MLAETESAVTPPAAVAPALSDAIASTTDPAPRRKLKRALTWLASSAASFAATFALIAMASHVMRETTAARLFGLGFLVSAIAGVGSAAIAISMGLERSTRPRSVLGALSMVATALAGLFMMLLGALATLFATVGFSRGRQLRRLGRVLLPRVVGGSTWAHTKVSVVTEVPIPAEVAAQWRENGRTEHASVAAFARLTLDLLALGAPPHVIATSNADGLEEIRHAELCFSLARSLDGRAQDPSAFPEAQRARTLPHSRTLGLAMLAVDSLVDGALHEGVSARIIAKLAKRCEVAAVRGVLKEIAADEGRHAAHGWDVVEWCLSAGGQPVAEALRGAIRALPERMHSSLPLAARDGSWERWGIHGDALEREEYTATRTALVARVEKMVAARAAA